MLVETVAEESGDGHHAAAMVLGRAEVELPSDVGERFGDLDAGADEVASFASEGGGFSPAEPAVGEDVDEGAVGLLDGVGEPVDLVGVEEQHLVFGLSWSARVVGPGWMEVAGFDGEGQHGVEYLAGLTDPGRPETG